MAKFIDAVIRLKDDFSKPLQRVNNLTKDFSKTTRNLGRDIKKTGRVVSNVGKSFTKSFTLPAIGLGTISAKIGMDFEKQMSYVKAVTGATKNEIKELEKAARDAGKATSKNSREAAEALGYMGLAGWSVQDSIKGLMPILRLAEAGNIELGRASDLVINSMNTMGITIDEMPKYLDAIAQGARSASTDIDEVLEAILGVGASLKATKVDMKEGIAVIGALGNSGIKASEAGTALSAILTNLSVKRGAVGSALKELRINPFNKDGTFKGIEGFFKELNDKLKTMTDEQSQRILGMIAGKEHIKSAQAIMTAINNGSLKEINKSLEDSNGILNSMADTMLDNNLGSITILKSALEELALKIYEILSPKISDITLKIRKFVKVLDEMNPVLRENIIKFTMFVATIGPIILLIGTITSKIGKCIMTVGKLGIAIKSAGGIIAWLIKPGMIIVGVIGLIVIASILLYKNLDKIKNVTNKVIVILNKFAEIIKAVSVILLIIFFPALFKTFVIAMSKTIISTSGLILKMLKLGIVVLGTGVKINLYLVKALILYSKQGWKTLITITKLTSAWIWQKAVLIRSTTGMYIMSAAQYVLNAAISACPILLFIIFIGVLCTVLVKVYKKSERFREIIRKIKETMLDTIKNIVDKFKLLKSFFTNPIKGLVNIDTKNNIKNFIDGSHRNGIKNIPFDGYIAQLHKDERVLTRSESENYNNTINKASNQAKQKNSNIIINISGTVIREEADIDKIAKSLVRNLEKTKLNMV